MEELIALLAEPLDTENGAHLTYQLAQVEGWQGVVSTRYRAAQEAVAKARNRYLLPKSKDWTDMDRTVQLEAAVATQQREADELRDMQEQIQRRISLGQTLLRGIRAEVESNVRAV